MTPASILAMLPGVASATYGGPEPGYVDAPTVRQINCCTLVERLVIGALRRDGSYPWSSAQHMRAMQGTPEHPDPWGPVEVLIEAGLAYGVRGPEPWTVAHLRYSGDAKDPFGHTVLIAQVRGERCAVIQANSRMNGTTQPCVDLRGVERSSMGTVLAVVGDGLPTWPAVIKPFRLARFARLRIS